MAGELTLRVITPDAVVLDTTAAAVSFTAVDGSMGVLPRHAPMVAALAEGPLSYSSGSTEEVVFVSGGFAEVRDDTVRIVSPASEGPSEIDVERAQRAAERARGRLRTRFTEVGDYDQLRAEAALRRALMRLQIVELSR